MSFMTQVVFYAGVVDVVLIMAFGIFVAVTFITARKELLDSIWDRVFPSLAAIVLSSIAAAMVLGAIRWLLGMPL